VSIWKEPELINEKNSDSWAYGMSASNIVLLENDRQINDKKQ
jgi:hypothetical protein